LVLLMLQPSLRATIGQQAQNTYTRYFRPDVMARELEKAFDHVVAR
jgi:hypothetical protein